VLSRRAPRPLRLPRRIRPLAGLAAATAAAVALPLLLSAAPASAAVSYVALGDSYSSGLGAGSYISSSGSCYRSYNAYPELWAQASSPSSFSFVACAGATTTDVIDNQLSALSPDTTLISITIGGNDVGFASVMETCVLGSDSDCVNAVNQAESTAENQLPGWLDTLYGDMRADAPNARVVVLGYPQLYDLAYSSVCPGLSTTKRKKLNEGAGVLDSVIQQQAAKYGFTYGDAIAAFSGHELCDPTEWLKSVDWSWFEDSYHPNKAGQAGGYEPLFAANA
jgi:lysophospholipase L1-like esterase